MYSHTKMRMQCLQAVLKMQDSRVVTIKKVIWLLSSRGPIGAGIESRKKGWKNTTLVLHAYSYACDLCV